MDVFQNPVGVALEYVNARTTAVERYKGAHGAFFGNANRGTQLQFIEMCNQFAARFANECPVEWNEPEWAAFSVLDIRGMSQRFGRTLTLTEWEGCSELAKTYLAILRMRLTP